MYTHPPGLRNWLQKIPDPRIPISSPLKLSAIQPINDKSVCGANESQRAGCVTRWMI
jgi:hypothetical protein